MTIQSFWIIKMLFLFQITPTETSINSMFLDKLSHFLTGIALSKAIEIDYDIIAISLACS